MPEYPKVEVVEAAKEKIVHYSARFVKENKLEGHEMKREYIGGMPFNKSYTLVNDGEHPWPLDV